MTNSQAYGGGGKGSTKGPELASEVGGGIDCGKGVGDRAVATGRAVSTRVSVVLLFFTALSFFGAFWSCLVLGMAAVAAPHTSQGVPRNTLT